MSKTSSILIFWPKMSQFERFLGKNVLFLNFKLCKRFDKFQGWLISVHVFSILSGCTEPQGGGQTEQGKWRENHGV